MDGASKYISQSQELPFMETSEEDVDLSDCSAVRFNSGQAAGNNKIGCDTHTLLK